jgi:glycosyltransferase involved in cell wall biosynthesis
VSDPWDALGERVVMVTRYSERDGIGRYAEQLIAARSEGRSFLRVGIPEGPGDYHRDFHRPPGALWLLRDAKRGDDVVVQWHPHYYVRGGAPARVAAYASWGLLAQLRRVMLVIHEPDPPASRIEEAVRAWAWRRPWRVVFHSEVERAAHADRYGRGRRQEHMVTVPGDFYTSSVTAGRSEARETLGLPGEPRIALMIGFFSAVDPDKGYDRAMAAFREAAVPGLELHVVGSPIRPGETEDRLVEELRRAAAEVPGIRLHEGFVDDEAFDLWIRAADAVLIPYRTSSTSGVLSRARLLGTPAIVSDVGGLREQAGPGDVVFADDAELRAAVEQL